MQVLLRYSYKNAENNTVGIGLDKELQKKVQ